MSEKKPKFEQKWSQFKKNMKEDPTSRAVAITAVALILAVSLLITVTSIANRAKKLPTETTGGVETTERGETTLPEGTAPEETKPVDALPTAFLLPAEGVLYTKHDATAQVFSNTMQDYRVHLGIDIGTEEGAPVCAVAAGKIEKIWTDVRYGQCIAVSHGGSCISIYKNLSVELPEGITEGASVTAGELIGAVGDTAMVEIADEPHLHFEMTVGGLAVDPLEYFDADALASLNVDESYEG